MAKFLIDELDENEELKLLDEALHYNDNSAQYSTKTKSKGVPRYEEVQIRFNQILQKRIQLDENLTGSQIAYLLDYYVDRCFDVLNWRVEDQSELAVTLQAKYLATIQQFIKNRRKLFSLRFSNEEVLDVLVELFFETDLKVFTERFLSMKLNREVYLAFLDSVFTPDIIKNQDQRDYFSFYRKQYIEFKNLLLGNYIRYSFAETNKFFAYYRANVSLEAKEDYFSGLMLVILKVIDKYDSFKGTLTSFIENWFKDYRTSFKTRQKIVDGSIDIEDEAILQTCSLEVSNEEAVGETKEVAFKKQILENIIITSKMPYEDLTQLVLNYPSHFPNIIILLQE